MEKRIDGMYCNPADTFHPNYQERMVLTTVIEGNKVQKRRQ